MLEIKRDMLYIFSRYFLIIINYLKTHGKFNHHKTINCCQAEKRIQRYWKNRWFNLKTPLKTQFKNWRGFLGLIKAMGIKASYRKHFWQTLGYCLIKNPKGFRFGVVLAALYLHFGPFTEQAMANLDSNMENSYIKRDIPLTASETLQKAEISPPASRHL